MPHIVTLTFNPALDVSTTTPRVEPAHKLRCSAPVVHPGGGGINVARVLHRLGADVRATFTAGGPTGTALQALLHDEGVSIEVVPTAEDTRQSFAALSIETGEEYRFVLPGPRLSDKEQQACMEACLRAQHCEQQHGSGPHTREGESLQWTALDHPDEVPLGCHTHRFPSRFDFVCRF